MIVIEPEIEGDLETAERPSDEMLRASSSTLTAEAGDSAEHFATAEITTDSSEQSAVAPARTSARSRAAADSLANSFLVLCALSLVQPVLGLARGMLFCRWLTPEQLGRWDLSLGLLTFATPLLLLGIPGSFGRYVGHYREHGGLGKFVRQATLICLGIVSLAAIALFLSAGPFASFYYGDATRISLSRAVALTLVPLAAYGFVVELLTSLRLFRASSMVQLARTTAFLGFGTLLVWGWRPSATSVVLAFGLATVSSIVLALWWLVAVWRDGPHVQPAGPVVVWQRVMPFAIGVWLCNLVTNAFDMVNPYMLAHFSHLPPQEAMAEVGNLHSARILPLLMFAFSNTLASMLIPHLTHAWETGQRANVGRDVRLFVKLYSLALTLGSACILVGAPTLFGVVFRGKYDGGLHVLPWTMLGAAWVGLAFIAQTYLWCREEARLSSLALAAGLIANLIGNAALVPVWGLQGTVIAGAIGMVTVLIAALWFGRRLGLQVDRSILCAAAMPLVLLAGPWVASLLAVTLLIAAVATPLLFDAGERQLLKRELGAYWQRLPVGQNR